MERKIVPTTVETLKEAFEYVTSLPLDGDLVLFETLELYNEKTEKSEHFSTHAEALEALKDKLAECSVTIYD